MDSLILSRAQFGDTAAFHILWPLLSIGLSFFMLIMEALWRYTGDEKYYRQVRFWSKVFILTFGIGVASGIPLQFQFGTNWASFSHAAGDFFGNVLGFESTVAFALEAAFLAIFVFGWKRVGPKMHLFANAMVFVGATLSAFWIMAANSWMQIPRGVVYVPAQAGESAKLVVTNYVEAIFNPGTLVSFGHMWLACIVTTMFFMMGLCALALLRRAKQGAFFLDTFKYCLIIAAIAVPAQIVMGHTSGAVVAQYQPQKLAAIELHWDTNTQGAGAAWSLLALPDKDREQNSFDIAIPNVLSLITTNSPTGQVKGLNDFPAEDRPTKVEATLAFYAFRTMVAIGFFFLFLIALGLWYWYKGKLALGAVVAHRKFLWLWILATPLGFVATIAGWMTREIGRQPWVLYNIIRTKDAVSPHLSAPAVATTFALFNLLYAALLALFIYFTYRILATGPDLESPLP